MRWLVRLENSLSRFLEVVMTLCFAVILVLTVLLVLLRYGFNSSIIWGSELMNYLFIYTTALGAAVAVGSNAHIRISCVLELTSGRLRKVMDFFCYALIGLVNAVLGWYSLPWIKSVGGFESPVMRVPMWTVQITVPVGCGLACVYCLVHMIYILAGHASEGGESC